MSDLSIFFRPGDVVEMRALGKSRNAVQSGYFKDAQKLQDTIRVLDTTGEHKGIYFVLNKINPALYARRPDSLSTPRENITTTADKDIERRYWMPVDFDPCRPAEISSTDEEHEQALTRAREVRDHLRSLGWPEPIYADSGNGAHLLYAIDLPNDDKSTETIELALKALDVLFSDNKVKIDTKNYNAARIWKAYGTMARKGANVAERPWRRSALIDVPSEVQTASAGLLDSLAWTFKQKDHREKYEPQAAKIDLEQWLSAHGLDVAKQKNAHGGGTMYILDTCPWDSQHTDRSAWAVQFPSGAIAAGCHHDGCSGKGWRELRALFEKVPKSAPRIESKQTRPKLPALELRLEDVADIDYDDRGGVKAVKFNPARAADAICQYMHIISTPDKKIWVYENGYYRPDGDIIIEQTFDRVAACCFSINNAKEVLKKIYLRTLIGVECLDINPYLLCCKNGVVDLRSGEFLEHSPEYFLTQPCDVAYDKDAYPAAFLGFLENSLSNDDDRLTLIDWMVACAVLAEFEYILFLTGHGSNGKHIYEAVLQAFFGSESTEAISLDELTSSRFAIGYLRRARLCISTETNPDKSKTEIIKKISGNDWLSADVKNKDRARFKAYTQLIFDSNSMPIFEDTSYGFTRRFTRVVMPYKFVDEPDENDLLQRKADRHLLEKLTTDQELSGILNLIIHRAKDIAEERKIHRRADSFERYEEQSYSVSDFVDKFLEFDPLLRDYKDWQESSDYIFSKFEEYTKYTIGAKASRKKFSYMLGRENGESSRVLRLDRTDGMPCRGFRGLKFDDLAFQTFIDEKKAYYTTCNDSSFCNDKKRIDSNRSSRCNVTDVTVYNEILCTFRECHSIVETELDRSVEHIVTNCVTEAADSDMPKSCNDPIRYNPPESGLSHKDEVLLDRALRVIQHLRNPVTPFILSVHCENLDLKISPKMCAEWLKSRGWIEGVPGWEFDNSLRT